MKIFKFFQLCLFCLLIFIFNVYSTNISSCQTISSSGSYTLNQSLSTTGNCLTITSSNVSLDCQNFIIDGDSSGADYGITSTSKTNLSINNCYIKDFFEGINFVTITNSTINNSVFTNNGQSGIGFYTSSNYNLINNITANSSNGYGVYLFSSSYNLLTSILVYNTYTGIRITSNSGYNNLTNSNLTNNTQDNLYVASDNNNIRDSSITGKVNEFWNVAGATYTNISNYPSQINLSSNQKIIVPGSYTLVSNSASNLANAALILTSNVSLDCQGFIIDGSSSGSSYGIYTQGNTNKNNISINNCFIKDFEMGINFNYVTNSTINNTILTNNFNFNTYFDHSNYNKINNISSNNSAWGIYFTTSSYNNITASNFSNTSSLNINLASSNDNYFYFNSFDNSSKIGYSGTNYFYINQSNLSLGNSWRTNFTCSNTSDYYNYTFGDYIYSICNSTDYLVSGSTYDRGPIITKRLNYTYPQAVMSYVYPTPENNLNKLNLTSFTINVSVDIVPTNCTLYIDSTSYLMTYSNNYCYYTYTISNLTNITTYSFYVNHFYQDQSTNLNTRTIYLYPTSISSTKVPAVGIFSFILFIVTIFWGFILN